MLKAIAIAAVLLTAAAAGYWLQQSVMPGADRQQPSGRAPAAARPEADGKLAFALHDLEGNLRELSEWAGTPRIVNFWATWCAPCRREIPLLKQVQSAHGPGSLQVIGVAVDYREDVAAYAADVGFNYPILIGEEDAIAAAESTGMDFQGLPVTMLVSAEGDVIKIHLGELFEQELRQMVDVARRMDSGELDLAGARERLGTL